MWPFLLNLAFGAPLCKQEAIMLGAGLVSSIQVGVRFCFLPGKLERTLS